MRKYEEENAENDQEIHSQFKFNHIIMNDSRKQEKILETIKWQLLYNIKNFPLDNLFIFLTLTMRW